MSKSERIIICHWVRIRCHMGSLTGNCFILGSYAIHAWGSSILNGNAGNWGPMNAWKGSSKTSTKFFHSNMQVNPWVRFQLNKVTVITSVTIVNRWDCCGNRLRNIQVRAGMANNINNPVVGTFKGPGKSKGVYVIRLTKAVRARYIVILMKGKGYLQVNGIRLNEKPVGGKPKPKGKLQRAELLTL